MTASAKDPIGSNAQRTDAGTAWGAPPVTPSDTVDVPGGICYGLYIGVAGNLSFTDGAGNHIVGYPVPAGPFPVCVTRVWATSTTATNILALQHA